MKSTKISQFNAAIVLTIIGLLFFAVYAQKLKEEQELTV